MRSPFSFAGQISRRDYAIAAPAAFFSQHLAAFALVAAAGGRLEPSIGLLVNPLRAASDATPNGPPWVLLVALVAALLVAWVLAALSFRRARDASEPAWMAVATLLPVLQIPFILWLMAARPYDDPDPDAAKERGRLTLAAAIEGLLAGGGLAVVAAVLSVYGLKTYGWALFFAAPLAVGIVTGWLANREVDIGYGATMGVTLLALLAGSAALLVFAIEGLICLIMAAPIMIGIAAIGIGLGRGIALRSRGAKGGAMMGVALIPIMLAADAAMPPRAGFESIETIEVAAPPAAVWDSIVHMGPIPEPPAAPFRWGLAYPMRGRIDGEGVGAVREGVFSTGVAYERVTEWEPGRKLSFVVLSDPPNMRELSPYGDIATPHVHGYFRTLDARFTITPLARGRTRLTLATKHELDLEPALYWIPWAQWTTHVNKRRVLEHFRRQAEAN